MNKLFELIQAQQAPQINQQHVLQQQLLSQQRQFQQQLQQLQTMPVPNHPFTVHGPASPQNRTAYNAFPASSPNQTNANTQSNATVVIDHSPQTTASNQSQNQSPSYQARVVNQPSYSSHVLCVDTGRSSETAKAHRG
eukprot:TRINITY_DN9966_c0_g1_i1.p1 TRINITY_DN9966_c0_g1~~TRINITY_DN9966_c0_g1_i1.p1  ORF type:complete len:138 (-),score=51.49 TRINITY_DN9966_c0_g1_i1:2-415(-)